MGGGIISLVANGAQDVYLTGNPQITYFKVIYRRYTNFAVETIEQAIDSAKPGGRYSVQIQRNGDLATKTALRIRVPAVTSDVLSNGTEKVAWVRRLGHALIKSLEIKIGGMRIDWQVGTWMDVWYELTHTFEEERGYRALIGDVEEMTTLKGRELAGDQTEVLLPEYTLYIPFQFWFCRNYGLALPLIALQYHEVRVEIELEDITKLMCWTGSTGPNLSNFTFKDAGVMVDYVYLESAERRRYAQLGHEYLIEQVQFNGEENIAFNSGSTNNNGKYKLTYNHPTKEIVFAAKIGAFNGEANRTSFGGSGGRGKFLTYTNRDCEWNGSALDYAAKNLAEGCVFVGLDGDVCTVNRQDVHAVVPGYTNSAGNDSNAGHRVTVELKNRDVSKVGSKSLDEINGTGVCVHAYNTFFNDTDFKLFGTSKNGGYELSDFINSAHVVVSHTNGRDVRIECVEVDHNLSLTDLSIPVEDWEYDNRSPNDRKYCVHKDVTVVQFSNYGLRLDGKGNPVQSALIQLNGHDRFKVQEGSYFNYYQTRNHHTRTPADGINVYSFALHPEKHQPSGTTNLSRIDSTYLNVNFADSLRQYNRPKLDIARDTRFYIFAFSYNVLRVMSGMAGLAYSN